jgi:pentatricopeptide repeat protein
MDAYGTIEPVDVTAMEQVFLRLQKDERVQVQGSHWASLIHVHGCVNKDLNKAIEVFESIATHPSTTTSSTPLPDAVTYESLINVLVTHRRTDLIPHYIHRLQASNIHITAYIVNFMIKGYAAVGDLEEARALFEGLEDPPQGVAASNNHVPHEGAPASQVPQSSPVYREVCNLPVNQV